MPRELQHHLRATLFAQDNAVASRKQAVPLSQEWLAGGAAD